MTASRVGLLQRLLSGGSWALAGQFWLALSSLLIHWFLARLLPPDQYGAYALLFSVANGGMVLGALGLNQALVRLVAESEGRGLPGRAAQAVDLCFRYAGSFAMVLGVVAGFAGVAWLAESVFESSPMLLAAWPTGAWIVALVLQAMMAEAFRGYHDIRAAVVFGGGLAAGLTATILGGFWLSDVDLGLGQVVTVVAGCSGTSVVFGGLFLWRRTRPARPAGGLEAGALRRIAWPMWVNGITHFSLTQASIWLVGIWLVEDQVALYGAAQRLVALIGMPLMVINAVTPPLIAEQYARGEKQRLERILRFLAALAALPALLLLAVFAFAGGPVLTAVFGDFYHQAWPVLLALGAGQAMSVVAGSCGISLAMLGHQKSLMVITVSCGLLSLLVSLAVIDRHGIFGVAVVTASVTALQNLLFVLRVRQTTGLWTYAGWKYLWNWRLLIRSL